MSGMLTIDGAGLGEGEAEGKVEGKVEGKGKGEVEGEGEVKATITWKEKQYDVAMIKV